MDKLSQEEIDDYYHGAMFDWKQSKSNLPKDVLGWARIFPGPPANQALKQRIKLLNESIQVYVNCRIEDMDSAIWYNNLIDGCNKEIEQITFLLGTNTKAKMSKFEDRKAVALRVPIETLFPTPLTGPGQLKGSCPFHKDKSPSFSISKSKNKWYCFSESVGGDVIAFAMRLWDVDFITAVNRLSAHTDAI